MCQLAADFGCAPGAFRESHATVVLAALHENRRKFRATPYFFQMASFGYGLVASVHPVLQPWAEAFFAVRRGNECFFYNVLCQVDAALAAHGKQLAGTLEYYLPQPQRSIPDTGCGIQWHNRDGMEALYHDVRWQNALLYDLRSLRPDMLAVSAWVEGEMVGMASASADSDTMWQIGIDVLPKYRERGIGTQLVGHLTDAVLERGKLPYYGTWFANVASRNVALRCGYAPAWVECVERE